MKKKIKAIILCGGKGKRLLPLTKLVPKPLVRIKRKPILEYILNYFSNSLIDEFIIATGYRSIDINKFINKSSHKNKCKVIYTGNNDILVRIKKCLSLIKDEDFLVLYGDTISDINLNKLTKFHFKNKKPATVTLYQLKSSFGLMQTDKNDNVISYNEKPKLNKWINIGYFYFSNKLINDINKFRNFENFLNHIIKKNKLNAYKHYGKHITVNTLNELNEAKNNINEIFYK
tara:strand:+ start:514 stop:1206 length:693 start_codon:yes stop_codon:yes gene_type:complete